MWRGIGEMERQPDIHYTGRAIPGVSRVGDYFLGEEIGLLDCREPEYHG